jgi:hypothetical protein
MMKATVSLDDDLFELAKSYTGLSRPTDLMREALTALIQRESGRCLAALGGSEPDLRSASRRRNDPE